MTPAPLQYVATQAAILQARNCGINGDTEARLRGLAAHATPIAHEAGNAAYGPFLLLLRGREILAVTLIGPQPLDARPLAACKICKGLMTYPYRTVLDGVEGIAQRPCPRAFDPNQPICDTLRSNTDAR